MSPEVRALIDNAVKELKKTNNTNEHKVVINKVRNLIKDVFYTTTDAKVKEMMFQVVILMNAWEDILDGNTFEPYV